MTVRTIPASTGARHRSGDVRALRDGDDFALTLHFQHAGSVDTRVLVQQGR